MSEINPDSLPMVSSDLWRNMAMLPPEQRPVLISTGSGLVDEQAVRIAVAQLADPGLIAACARSGGDRD